MDQTIKFLRELVTRQQHDPNHDPTVREVAYALDLDHEEAEELLRHLLDDKLVSVRPTPPRVGDGPLDALLELTTLGRQTLRRGVGAVDQRPQNDDSSKPPEPTWHWRDLPVLRAAVSGVDQEPILGIRLGEVAAQTGLSTDDVYRAAKALQSGGYVELREYVGPVEASSFRAVSGNARREAGQWPTEQNALDRMIAALDTIAENTNDEDTRTKAQRFAAWLRASGTTVGLSVASSVITGQMPGQ